MSSKYRFLLFGVSERVLYTERIFMLHYIVENNSYVFNIIQTSLIIQ